VPLVIRDPKSPGPRRLSGQVRLVDLYPTVLALAGLEPPVPHDGVDLTPRLAGDASAARHLPAFCQTDLEETRPELASPSFGLRLPPWKYIEPLRGGPIELYDLESDPAEEVNLAEEHPEIVEEMAASLESWMAATEPPELPREELPPQAVEALRALGYMQ
jgi:arylsulfatase A-like enzyme